MVEQPTLAICVATFRRPERLAELLDSLANAEFPKGYRIELRVIDNDPLLSAASVLERWLCCSAPFAAVKSGFVPTPNISAARNATIDFGPAARFFFVDDDEIVAEDCLLHLVETMDSSDADAVVGFVGARLPAASPRWVRQGKFLDHPTGRSGAELPWTEMRSGCTLVRGEWFEFYRFDAEFGRSGGEDSALFRQIAADGGRFVAEPRAIAWESVGRDRTRLRAILRRAWRSGLSFHRVDALDGPNRHPAIRAAGRTVLGLLRLAAGLPALVVGSPVLAVRGLVTLALAGGGLVAWLRPEVAAENCSYGRGVA